MKRNALLITTFLITAAFFSSCATTKQSKTDNNIPKEAPSIHQKIIGGWYFKEITYTFNKDGYATFTMGEQTIGGSDLFAESILKYEIDDSKDPVTMDLVHIQKATGKIRNTMPMIIKFVNDNHLMIRSFMTKTRPKEFVEGDDEFTIVFDRKK